MEGEFATVCVCDCVYTCVFIILAEYGDICGLIWDHTHTGNNNSNKKR